MKNLRQITQQEVKADLQQLKKLGVIEPGHKRFLRPNKEYYCLVPRETTDSNRKMYDVEQRYEKITSDIKPEELSKILTQAAIPEKLLNNQKLTEILQKYNVEVKEDTFKVGTTNPVFDEYESWSSEEVVLGSFRTANQTLLNKIEKQREMESELLKHKDIPPRSKTPVAENKQLSLCADGPDINNAIKRATERNMKQKTTTPQSKSAPKRDGGAR